MITKDINGNDLSANYDTYVAEPSRRFTARIKVDGDELSCAIKKLTITKGACGSSESFSLGNIMSSMMDAELLEVDANIKGQVIQVEIGLWTGSAYEYVNVGHFIPTEVIKTAYATKVTAYGFTLTKTADTFTVPDVLSLQNIANAITTATGVVIAFDSLINTTRVIGKALPQNCTCYQALQIIASVIGGYVVDTYNGHIAIKRFSDTPTVSVATTRMLKLPQVSEDVFTVTGVKVIVSEETEDEEGTVVPEVSYEYGTPVVMYDNNEYMTAELFDMYKTIVGYAYQEGVIDLSLGDPRIEGTDVLSVSDVNGSVYVIPCHTVTHIYDGGFLSAIASVKPTNIAEGMANTSPISQRIDTVAVSAYQAQSSANYARTQANIAKEQADEAEAQAIQAKSSAESAQASANEASALATQAKSSAESAQASAQDALADARKANKAANGALDQLSTVEDVIGVLNWVSEHGTYKVTSDTEVQDGKYYFTRSGTGTTQDPYVYTVVVNPTGSPAQQGYYELDSVDEAVTNFISTHLVLTNAGLWVLNDANSYKVLLANDGMKVYDSNGVLVSTFGESITLSSTKTQYIGGENAYIVFDTNTGTLTIGGTGVIFGGKTLSEVMSDIEEASLPNLRIDSSRGTVFKNTEVSTVLSVAIYYKTYRITDRATLRSVYNSTAYLQWQYQGYDEITWHTLANSDSRLSNDGFTLTLTPADVSTKIVFKCELITA